MGWWRRWRADARNKYSSNKNVASLLKIFGKRLAAGQSIHSGIFTNILLPRFFAACVDDLLQQSNTQKIVAIVGAPMQSDHGVHLVMFSGSFSALVNCPTTTFPPVRPTVRSSVRPSVRPFDRLSVRLSVRSIARPCVIP